MDRDGHGCRGGALNGGSVLGTVEFYQPQKMAEDGQAIPLTPRDDELHCLSSTVLVEQPIQKAKTVQFLGFAFRARKTVWHGHLLAHGFRPAVSPKALKTISRTIRGWALHHRSDKSLQDLAKTYNPYIEGWINYYGQFYRKQLRPTLLRIDTYLVRWARWKFKRLRGRYRGPGNG
jgi:hypothetical protein